VIRGLAVGKITDANTKSFLRKEIKMVIWLSLILGTAGCIRAAIFMTPILETLAITTSLLMIVSISIVLGSLLPLGMKKVRIDPAHSSTSIQVIMDIIGVTIIVMVSRSVYWLSGFLMGSSNIEDER
jgi:magnesium transporter